MKTIVLKFGGASVATPESFSRIVDIILKIRADYPYVIVVVSAMGNSTDELIKLAQQVNSQPSKRELDMLLSVGERISMSLLAMALNARGVEAKSFTGSQSGIITTSDHSEALVIAVRPHRLKTALEEEKVVIVAGFQGVSREGEITTLGRGGSDTSAVALAIAMDAERVDFYKDVPGIFSSDPKKNLKAEHFSLLNYDQALTICLSGARVLHSRCLELAKNNGVPLRVLSFNETLKQETWIMEEGKNNRPVQSQYEAAYV